MNSNEAKADRILAWMSNGTSLRTLAFQGRGYVRRLLWRHIDVD